MSKENEVKFKATKIIDYPSFRQSTDYSCGVSAIQSALIYCFGSEYDVPESELYDKLKTTKKGGTEPSKIVSFLKSKGMKVEAEVLSQKDLKENIKDNNPIILCMQAWGKQNDYSKVYKEGHYATAIGYNNEGFIFEDPSISGRYGFIKYDELDARWHDVDKNGKKYDHVGIIINCKKKYNPSKMQVIESKKEVKSMALLECYLNFLYGEMSYVEKDIRGANLPVEGDDRPNWIGKCMRLPVATEKINCLRRVREMTAMNPFYKYRIDRFIDAITQNYEPSGNNGMVPEVQD